MSANRDEIIKAWLSAQKALKEAQAAEIAARWQVVGLLPTKVEGKNIIDLGAGYKVEITLSYNWSLDNKGGKLDAVLQHFGDSADDVVSWYPKLKPAAYRKLPNDYRAMLAPLVTQTPALPSLEFIDPRIK